MREARYGGLDVRLTGGRDREGGGESGDPTVVLCHGFGAQAHDLVPLWRVLDVPRETRFVFPGAPIELGPEYLGGRAWWPIDLSGVSVSGPARDNPEQERQIPDGLARARAMVNALLDEVREKMAGPLFIGGFSQGAMLSCDVALRSEVPLAGLILLSGMPIAIDDWRRLAPSRKGLAVVQSHGRADPLLAFAAAERLRDLLTEAGLGVDWVPFNGGHEIAQSAMDAIGRLVTRAAT